MTVTSGAKRAATSVRLAQVSKTFGGSPVLHHLDLDIKPGEFLSLLGPSGCGKTTALRLIAGLENVTSGVISMDDADVSNVPTNKRDIGMVFQAYSLFPHLTVLENTAFGLRMRHEAKAPRLAKAREALELVGLGELADRHPASLSGGQQQRVALARALVTSPRVLLLDEPLSALDAKVRSTLRLEIRRIQQELGITTIFVTHDQEEALAISDRVAVMNVGRIEQIGAPEELYENPASPFVASFVGISSIVPAAVSAGDADLWGVRVPVLGTVPDGSYDVFVRPENVRLAVAGDTASRATVQTTTFLGSFRRTQLLMSDGVALTIQHAIDEVLTVGTSVDITIDPVPVVVRS
jgi:putative spermidine/putrescine transport system ATP-binding protein